MRNVQITCMVLASPPVAANGASCIEVESPDNRRDRPSGCIAVETGSWDCRLRCCRFRHHLFAAAALPPPRLLLMLLLLPLYVGH